MRLRYDDHRRGPVEETLTAVECIGRMIQPLPAENFRMVRSYGIDARAVHNKVQTRVADVLVGLQQVAQQVRDGGWGIGERRQR